METRGPRERKCSSTFHGRLKADDAAWSGLPAIAPQVIGDQIFEQRNCRCGSTLAREVVR